MTNKNDNKALVTVLEDIETARTIVEKLHGEGFSLDKIELVTHNFRSEAPQVETPYTSETTADSMVEAGAKGAGLGAAVGLIAAVFAPFPGVGLAMIVRGGLVGGAAGSVSGIEHAIKDDSVDLPSLNEYEQLVKNGRAIVVVLGNHDEVTRASSLVADMPFVHSHIHRLHGHEFHEHPKRKGKPGSGCWFQLKTL